MKERILGILATTIIYSLFPLLLVQGVRVRKRTPRLPEANGPISGLIPGVGPPINLIVLGESTVAGVGASTHNEALTGQVAIALGRRTGRAVRWLAVGQNGVTAQKTRLDLVPLLTGNSTDILVVALGVNDVLRLHGPTRWSRDLEQLLKTLRQYLGNMPPIILAGMPPVGQFPAFPQPLRAVLGLRAKALDYCTKKIAQRWSNMTYCPTPEASGDGFATDGFHPGPLGYSIWGEYLAQHIAGQLPQLYK